MMDLALLHTRQIQALKESHEYCSVFLRDSMPLRMELAEVLSKCQKLEAENVKITSQVKRSQKYNNTQIQTDPIPR